MKIRRYRRIALLMVCAVVLSDRLVCARENLGSAVDGLVGCWAPLPITPLAQGPPPASAPAAVRAAYWLTHPREPPNIHALLVRLAGHDARDRQKAAEALAGVDSPFARAAVLRYLHEPDGEQWTDSIVEKLGNARGFTADEIVRGVEGIADRWASPTSKLNIRLTYEQSIGRAVAAQVVPLNDAETAALLARADSLARTDVPRTVATTETMRKIVFHFSTRSVHRRLMRDLVDGTVTSEELADALLQRAALRELDPDALDEMLHEGGTAAGIAAAIMDQQDACAAILRGKDVAAQESLPVCLTFLRERLPAAERHDEREAAFWRPHPQRTRTPATDDAIHLSPSFYSLRRVHPVISGATVRMVPDVLGVDVDLDSRLDQWERRLELEFGKSDAPDEIYALLYSTDDMRNATQVILRRTGQRVEMSWYFDDTSRARYELTAEESSRFTAQIDELDADNLPPAHFPGTRNRLLDYVHLTRNRGQRVTMLNVREGPPVYVALIMAFRALDSRCPAGSAHKIQLLRK